jgi:hypothetical protein
MAGECQGRGQRAHCLHAQRPRIMVRGRGASRFSLGLLLPLFLLRAAGCPLKRNVARRFFKEDIDSNIGKKTKGCESAQIFAKPPIRKTLIISQQQLAPRVSNPFRSLNFCTSASVETLLIPSP